MEPSLVHVWSTCHGNRAVHNGRQRSTSVQVATGILWILAWVQSAGKDEVAVVIGLAGPARPLCPWGSARPGMAMI
jgi:hypothetical protein